jgi:hypothetical protein
VRANPTTTVVITEQNTQADSAVTANVTLIAGAADDDGFECQLEIQLPGMCYPIQKTSLIIKEETKKRVTSSTPNQPPILTV